MAIKNLKFLILICNFIFLNSAFALNLDKMKMQFLDGDYKSAILEGEKLLANEPHSDELYYILGLSYLKDGNILRASDIFEIILKEFKESRFKEEAKLGLGDTYFLRADFLQAEDCYKRIIQDNPSTKLKAQVYYRLSQIAFKKGETQAAKEYLDKLRQEFPLNPEVILNRELYNIPALSSDFYYTVQVGAFSNIANAQNLTRKLIQKGYLAYIEEVDFQGKKSYRVRIGKLRQRQEAADLEKKLASEGYPTKICP